MTALESLKSSIDHLEQMESNKTHFYAMRAVCKPEHLYGIERHLQHAISGADQDRRNILKYAAQLAEEN